ncbi:uncharacterized protein LOC110859913 [Folsomia candida]|nr:uncharacterized protein LOC110859913 [Folsomia candida]
MNALIAVRTLRTAINSGSVPWSRSYASSSKVTQSKGTGSGSGGGSVPSVPSVPEPPSNVFKQTSAKDLGPGASKEGQYKNPEYFQYHKMSFAEMEIVMAKMRVPQPSAKKTGQ